MTYRLVAFDFDRTFVDLPARSTWELLGEALDCNDERRELRQEFVSRKIDYANWSRKTVELYKKLGLTRNAFYNIIKENVRPMNGAGELLNSLGKIGIRTAIVSGSIKNVYEFIRKVYGLQVDRVSFATEIYFGGDGNISGGSFSNYDYEGKVEVIKDVCKEFRIRMDECVMIGDSDNDIFAFREVGLPIAFCPQSLEVEEAAKYVIREKDLRKLLTLL